MGPEDVQAVADLLGALNMSKPQYRWAHQQRRKRELPLAYGRRCIYCGGVMLQWMPLDWDYTTQQITHARCNRSAGARYGNALRGLRRRYSTIYQAKGR
jgi:hypothetical protein